MSLSASKFEFAAEPGQKGTGEVFVINEGAEPVSVRVYAADQVIAEDGTATYVVPTINAGGVGTPASWVTFELPADAKSTGNIPYVDIPGGGRVPVKFEVTVPEGATPGDRQAVLFFEMFSPQGSGDKAATNVNARLGARIQTRVKGEIVEKLVVQPFAMPAVRGRLGPRVLVHGAQRGQHRRAHRRASRGSRRIRQRTAVVPGPDRYAGLRIDVARQGGYVPARGAGDRAYARAADRELQRGLGGSQVD